jgi:hypothetical protein
MIKNYVSKLASEGSPSMFVISTTGGDLGSRREEKSQFALADAEHQRKDFFWRESPKSVLMDLSSFFCMLQKNSSR